jgi:uncharacterized BrkB/YihY/UPF0761 family membrane protein
MDDPGRVDRGQPEASRYARLRAQFDHGRTKASETSDRLQAARGRSATIDTAYQAIDRDMMSGGGLIAGALAFRLFLVLLPVTLVFVSLLGLLSHLGIVSPDALSDSFGLTGLVATTISSSSDTSAWGDFVTLCITVPTVLYFLWQLVRALHLTHRMAWGMPLERVHIPARTVGWACAAMVVWVAIGAATSWLRESFGLVGLVGAFAFVLAAFVFWLFASWFLPHPRLPITALAPGAMVAALGMQGLQIVMVFYIAPKAEHASATYGALGVATAMLTYLYFAGRLIVASAVLNAAFWERRRPHGRPAAGDAAVHSL